MFDRAYFDQIPFDWFFFITPPEIVTRLLLIRHPALVKVVQKRGELTIKGYDNLSSLDGEYLTNQARLDVAKGDVVVVTTLPGINYTYEVK